MATAAKKYDDMNIDWTKVHAGDELETQRAMKSVERLCWWVLDRRAPGWRANRWDEEDIKQEVRLSLLSGTRHFNPERGEWGAYASRIAWHLACDVRNQLIWPVTGNARQAYRLNQLYVDAEDPGEYEALRGSLASIDAPVNPDGDTCLGDFILSPESEGWEDDVCDRLAMHDVMNQANLTELEATVFWAWFARDMAYREIDNHYELGSKRVDNALQRAKRKLRKTYAEMDAC